MDRATDETAIISRVDGETIVDIPRTKQQRHEYLRHANEGANKVQFLMCLYALTTALCGVSLLAAHVAGFRPMHHGHGWLWLGMSVALLAGGFWPGWRAWRSKSLTRQERYYGFWRVWMMVAAAVFVFSWALAFYEGVLLEILLRHT